MKIRSRHLPAVALVVIAIGCGANAWLGKPHHYAPFGPHYQDKTAVFRAEQGRADVVMLGNSLTESADWHELFPGASVLNRGVGGDTSQGMLARLDEVIARRPKLVMLMVGINDIFQGIPVPTIAGNIREIIQKLRRENVRVVYQSTLHLASNYRPGTNVAVADLNRALSDVCQLSGVTCLDLNRRLAPAGELLAEFSLDGAHLNAAGYRVWKDEIKSNATLLRWFQNPPARHGRRRRSRPNRPRCDPRSCRLLAASPVGRPAHAPPQWLF